MREDILLKPFSTAIERVAADPRIDNPDIRHPFRKGVAIMPPRPPAGGQAVTDTNQHRPPVARTGSEQNRRRQNGKKLEISLHAHILAQRKRKEKRKSHPRNYKTGPPCIGADERRRLPPGARAASASAASFFRESASRGATPGIRDSATERKFVSAAASAPESGSGNSASQASSASPPLARTFRRLKRIAGASFVFNLFLLGNLNLKNGRRHRRLPPWRLVSPFSI